MQVPEQVRRAVEMASSVDATKTLDAELPRLEALFQQMPPDDPNRPQVVKGLNVVYGQACRMVAAAAKAMGYGPMQTWPDTRPISMVAELHPVIWGTDWHQWMMAQAVMPKPHPWYTLPTEI